jgi:hypothetical protein
MRKTVVLGFIAGFLATLIFHQGTAFLLHHIRNQYPAVVHVFGQTPAAFNMAPTRPFGVPQVISLAFWGGLWGILLAAILRNSDLPDLLFGAVFGAVVTTLVAFTVVAYLKGLPQMAGGNRQIWWRAGLYNAAWGWGTALLLRPLALRG